MRTAAELDAGTLLGGYRIEGLVGRGGMGLVYRATQLALERTVALKLVAPELAQNPDFRARFEREAKLAAALEHPHVLPVHEAGALEGLLFLSMRYVEGRDLGSLLAEEGRLEPTRAAAILAQVAEALDAAHARGLVHRDVKPQNVLVEIRDGHEHAYLCDFGLTRVASSASGLTASGGFLGTLDYASPEQIRGEATDARSDVYALGCLLFQTLTGRVPYAQEDELAKLWAHLHEPPPAPSALLPELEPFDSVIARALVKEPAERHQAAGELARAALAAAEGQAERAPLRPAALPRPPTPLVGRRRELAEVGALLARSDVRLLTLTGAGGSGKTRLALALAAELAPSFGDGVVFCDLSAISDPALVFPTVAQALGLSEASAEPLIERLKGFLRERELLLVLDNVEQVVEAVPELAALLAAAPALTLLVTSRERLHLQAEHEYPVKPLSSEEALELFVERARAVKPDFRLSDENSPAVAAICLRLDGLPLALELAAARIKLLSPEAIRGRLAHGLDLLTGGARDLPARQQTLTATIEWSYDLLSDDEQQLFRHLSVFSRGCTLEAAEEVANAQLDVLQSLVEKSLLDYSTERYWMLETIREFGLARLEERGNSSEVGRRHAEFFLALAKAFAAEVLGPQQLAQVERLRAEEDNLRAALDWSRASGEIGLGQDLAAALWRFWYIRGALAEGRAWLDWAVSAPSEGKRRAYILDGLAQLTARLGDVGRARLLSDEAIAIWRAIGDRIGLVHSLQTRQIVVWGQEDAADVCAETMELARELGDEWTLVNTSINLSDLMLKRGDALRAYSLAAEALPVVRHLDPYSATVAAGNLAAAALELGKHDEAKAALHEALRIAVELGADEACGWAFDGLAAFAAASEGAWERAAILLGASDALRARTDSTGSATDERRRDQAVRSAASALGLPTFSELRAKGRAMTREEAIAYALSELPPGQGAGAHLASITEHGP